jgi:hypothetical protein
VAVKAQVGVRARHADIDERFAELVLGVGLAKRRLVPDLIRQRDDIHVMAMPTHATRLKAR